MNKAFKIILYWIALIAYMGFIFYLSSQSHPLSFLGSPELFVSLEKYHFDWIFHGGEYAVLGFLLVGCLGLSFERLHRSPFLLLRIALILGSVYGLTDEWHQHFTPMRDPSVLIGRRIRLASPLVR